jgi:hypothetical protein
MQSAVTQTGPSETVGRHLKLQERLGKAIVPLLLDDASSGIF